MESMFNAPANTESERAFVTPQLFDKIVASSRMIVAINTPRCQNVLKQFGQFAVRSGNSIYSWSSDLGITSLREGSLVVPNSARLPDALRHVQSSLQFGVYLFPELLSAVRHSGYRTQALALLRQIGRGRGSAGHVRKLVVIDRVVNFSDSVDDFIEHFEDTLESKRKLRLRDGRWVE
jgi:hypothetical protein